MSFVEPSLESILPYFEKLSPESKAQWGSMSAQRMVEHLTDVLRIATGENPQGLLIPEDRIERMQAFLESDKPMARDIQVPFAARETPLRNEELELAVDEFVDAWLHFEEHYEKNPGLKMPHPYYGQLDYEQWQKLNAKHLTHHFTQFGLI